MSGDSKNRSFSDSLVLDDSEKGVVITGITDDAIAAKSGLQAGDEIVAATIHLDHLNKNEVLNILKVLEPYDNNMKVLTKKELNASAGLGSLGLGLKDPAEMLNLKKDLSLHASAEEPVVSLDGLGRKLNAAEGLGGEISGPTLNGDLLSLNKPSADAGAKFTMPSLGLSGPDIKRDLDGALKAPDGRVSTSQLNTPNASLDIKKPEIKTDNLKYKSPKFAMPHFNLPQIKTPKSEVDVSGDVDLSSVSGNLETPDLNLSAPKLDLKSPDLGLNGPKVDLNSPGVNLEAPNADIEAPSGKIKWPNLKWKGAKAKGPDVNLNADLKAAHDVSLSTPKIDVDGSAPDVDINFPKTDIKAPDLDVQTPNLDIDATSGKINWPHLKWKKPKLHGPKADLDLGANLNKPDVDLSVPKLEGGINVPDVDINLPKADLKSSDLDMQTPNIDVDAPSGKINWPHLKWKKPKIQGPKADLSTPDVDLSVPKIDGEIGTPDVDLNLPKADVDVDAPSSKIKFPTLKKPKFLLSGPKGKSPDIDVDADVKAPDLNLSSEASLDGPDVDVKAPNVDIEAPSGKFKWPTLKKPKWSVSGSKVNGDLDTDISAPGLSLSAPKVDGEINAPDANLNLPKADMEGPKLDMNAPEVEGPSGKFKWLTLKKPKFGTLKGPKADIDADVQVPDVDLSADGNLSVPKIEGGIEAPDLNISLPNANVKGPDVDLSGPDLNLDSPDSKLKFPKLKLPKLKGSTKVKGPEWDADLQAPGANASLDLPKVDLDAPNVVLKAPNPSLSAPEIKGGLDVPDFDIDLSKADLKGPGVDLQAPEADVSAGKFKLPKIKLPKFGAKGPNLDVDADLKSPDLDLSLPDVDAQLSKADLTAPDVNLKAPGLNLSAPKIEGGIAAPDLKPPNADLKGSDIDLSIPDADIDAPAKLKMPTIKMPKFNIGGPKAQLPDAELRTPDVSVPNLDHDADLKTNIDLSGPKTNFNLPDFNLSNPKIKVPSVDLNKTDIDTNLPKAELEAPDVTMNVPKVDLKGPDAQLKTPDVHLDSSLGDFKLPHFNLPKLDLSSSEVEAPSVHPSVEGGIEAPKVNIGTPTADANISVPVADLSVPKLEGGIKVPEADVKAPNVDANLAKSKFPHFKLPKLSGSNPKTPEVNTSANLDISPDVSVSAPEVKTSLNTPELDITAEAESNGSPKSKLKWPFKWGFRSDSGTEEAGSGDDTETEVSNNEEEVPEFKFHRLPRNSIDGIGGIGDTLGLSKLDTEAKDYVISKGIRLPIVNATSKGGEKIDIMERLKMAKEKVPSAGVSPTEAKTDIDLKLAAPSLDVNASTEAGDASLIRGGTFKVEKPESALGLVAPEISTSDENDKLSLSLSNMLGLNIKDSDD